MCAGPGNAARGEPHPLNSIDRLVVLLSEGDLRVSVSQHARILYISILQPSFLCNKQLHARQWEHSIHCKIVGTGLSGVDFLDPVGLELSGFLNIVVLFFRRGSGA